MKKLSIIFICTIITGMFVRHVHGGEGSRLQLAYKIVEKTGMSKVFVDLSEASMETYFERYETSGGQNPSNVNPLKKIFREEVRIGEDELKWMLAEIYASHFTENDLKAISAFFDTPAGIVWIEKKLAIETEGEQVGLEWSRLLTQRVLKKFELQYGEKF